MMYSPIARHGQVPAPFSMLYAPPSPVFYSDLHLVGQTQTKFEVKVPPLSLGEAIYPDSIAQGFSNFFFEPLTPQDDENSTFDLVPPTSPGLNNQLGETNSPAPSAQRTFYEACVASSHLNPSYCEVRASSPYLNDVLHVDFHPCAGLNTAYYSLHPPSPSLYGGTLQPYTPRGHSKKRRLIKRKKYMTRSTYKVTSSVQTAKSVMKASQAALRISPVAVGDTNQVADVASPFYQRLFGGKDREENSSGWDDTAWSKREQLADVVEQGFELSKWGQDRRWSPWDVNPVTRAMRLRDVGVKIGIVDARILFVSDLLDPFVVMEMLRRGSETGVM